ncbi:urease accessory protein UreD [Pseudohongiella sp.]|uniref:Urease accessory protein UreD n=1 Tax=marine sediment metagenome TaxID=412755 RepID=A0A0F9W601_9ZZZZ|nr:urease accessory protein UreD [Pseudohongiella sp.]HDZ08218.1 urease accessory protein UreD [Pseudohongiella sp.]HEA63186.1 urease accessory protein UreD [Pseudohongiella sp.]
MSAVLAEQIATVRPASAWHASLALRFRQQARGCRLVSNVHHGPLYVQKPFYPEGADLAHVYLLHPPGGLVSGDRLGIDIQLEQGARVLVTTPGAGRVYRARSDRSLQQQSQHFSLAPESVMEWLPQEMIVFPGAFGRMDTTVDMSAGSTYMGWEICCLGLPASDLPFTHGELHQRLFIRYDGRPVLLENLHLDKANFELAAAVVGMNACPVSGVFVAGQVSGNTDDEAIQALMASLRASLATLAQPGQANVTLMNNFIIGRYLGHSAEDARRAFTALWQLVRPSLAGRAACLPRIWAT